MKSLLRFLIFVVIAGAAVGGLYLWKNARSKPLAETTDFAASSSRSIMNALDREFTTLVNQVLP